jgi:antitoxin MazE
MYTTIQKWGNSNALRIPKAMLEELSLRENDRVELVREGNAIVIKKAASPTHKTLAERLTAFYGKPVEEISRLESEELDWGQGEGDEVW